MENKTEIEQTRGLYQYKDAALITSKGFPIIKIRQSHDHFIIITEIPIPGNMVFILKYHIIYKNKTNTLLVWGIILLLMW